VSSYTKADLALGDVKRGILRLTDKYPLHAALLERMRPCASPTVGTMGVSASGEGVRLAFDPEFVLGLPSEQLGGVLLHEVHHTLFKHLTIDRSAYPDEWALTVALELSVNEFVKEPLPEGAITLEQFPTFPPLESFDERYRRLAKIKKRVPVESLDNHDVWSEQDAGRLGAGEASRAVDDLVHEAAADAGGLPEELQDALSKGVGKQAGDVPGSGVQVLAGDRPGRLDWRRLLRRYVGQVLEVRPVYHRPPRRFPELIGILPGRHRRASRPRVMAVLDTSGSISPAELEAFDGELARIARRHPVHVVECDCTIHRNYRYRGRLGQVEGGGGTDFRPALEPGFLRRLRADLVVYLTDGYGPAPDKPPYVPVIWCLTANGTEPASWGRVVRMSDV
jgi:predicted metal-dependent peptidase